MAKVAVEKEGPITVVSIDRFAEARNAVDPETAVLLREAFLAFDADDEPVGRDPDRRAAALSAPATTSRRRPAAAERRRCTMPRRRARWVRRAICSPSR